MVLGSFGADITEGELRRLADCTPFGTDALMAVEAARALGFNGTSKHTLSINELKALVADGHLPIVFVDLNPIDGIDDIHALVVVELDDQAITVLDPLQGERHLPFYVFTVAWARRHNLAIIISL